MKKKIINFLEKKKMIKKLISEFEIFFRNMNISVVGSSANLLGKKLGNKIDNCDLVARFNLAPTTKYESDVGAKYDIIVCNHLFFTNSIKRKNKSEISNFKNKVFIVISDEDEKYALNLNKTKYQYVDKSNRVFIFDNSLNHILRYLIISKYNFLKKMYYYKYGKKLSSGLIFVSLLKISNIRFKIFGFNLKKKTFWIIIISQIKITQNPIMILEMKIFC